MRTTLAADVIVIGGGPAGIAAVCRLVPAGRRVIWVDAEARTGGQIWRGGLPPRWSAAVAALRHHEGLQHLPGHAVIAADGPHALILHDTLHPAAPAVLARAPQLLLALGARERFLPFPGWTLPGVTGAGGLQALIKNGWPVAGQRVVFAGSGPLLLASADTARAAGAQVDLIAEQAPAAALARFAAGLSAPQWTQAAGLRWRLRGTPYRSGTWVLRADGERRLESVLVGDGRKTQRLPCDALGVGFGLVPNTELARLLGLRIEGDAIHVDAQLQTSALGVYAAGECTGIGGADKASIEGALAARVMLGLDDDDLRRQRSRAASYAERLARDFALRPELLKLADAQTVVCRCEHVAFGSLQAQRSARDAKLQTRCGMGACQGRICGPITQDLFGWPASRPREPLQPVPLACLIGDG
jgi:NADPH-dependent 2,4-dienoyl-CoA reductase/sulfur reductase-like enzyme